MDTNSPWKKFIDVFLAKNQELNLSAIRDADGVYIKHILDSLELKKVFQFLDGQRVIDVGTGGGIPLLPLAHEFPNVQFTGLDSVRKKTEAVADMAKSLGIQNVHTLRARAEDHQAQYDILTARAMTYIDNLLLRCSHLVKKGGYFILYKMYSEDEDKHIIHLIHTYRLTIERKHLYTLFPGDIQRVIYILKKADRLKDRITR